MVPQFYSRDASGIPTAWVRRMRESMARLTPRFSASRMVREYTEQHYLPAAAAYRARCADNAALGQRIAQWRSALERHWRALRFGDVRVETQGGQHAFEVEVGLGDVDPDAVRVELYADAAGDGESVRQEMKPAGTASGFHLYRAVVSAARPAADYTPRLIPHFPDVAIPLEDAHILWQR